MCIRDRVCRILQAGPGYKLRPSELAAETVGDIATKDADEAKLTEMMVGEKVELNIERPEPVDPVKRLELSHLTCLLYTSLSVTTSTCSPPPPPPR